MTDRSATVTCSRCRVAVPAESIGMVDRCLDETCPLTPRHRGPWFLTDEQAVARDAQAARHVAGIVERCVVPGMSEDAIVRRLAAYGVGAREWRRLRPLLEIAHG